MRRIERLALIFIICALSVPALASSFLREYEKKPLPKMKVPDVLKKDLSSKGECFVVVDKTFPFFAVNIAFKAGSIYESIEKKGLAELTGWILKAGGSAGLSPKKFDGKLADLGAHISVDTGRMKTSIQLVALSKDFDEAMKLLLGAVFKPRFDSKRLETLKGRMIEEIRRKRDEPSVVVGEEFWKTVVGENEPWGWFATEESVGDIKRDDVKKFYTRLYHPENMWVAASGDIDPEKLYSLLEKYSSGVKRDFAGLPEVPGPRVADVSSRKDINLATPYAYVRIGEMLDMDMRSPARYAGIMANSILGGASFKNRLMDDMRAKRGLVYSIGSGLVLREGFSVFLIGAAANPSKVQKVLDAAERHVQMMRLIQPSADELFLAKRSTVGARLKFMSDSFNVVLERRYYDMFDFPADSWKTYVENIEKVKRSDVRKFIKEFLNAKTMSAVIVTRKGKNSD